MSILLPTPYQHVVSGTFSFQQTDSEELFAINRKKFGKQWYWYDRPIEYKFNKLGYRMNKEVDQVDFDNYYAFFGCSFTEGIGLPIEDTFSYKIAAAKGVDYINASHGGSCPEFALYNFLQLIENAPKKPTHVIFNWPSIVRTMYWMTKDYISFKLPEHNREGWIASYNEFVMGTDHIRNRFEMILKTVRLITSANNIKLYETSLLNEGFDGITHIPTIRGPDELRFDDVETLHMRAGRDINLQGRAHPGFLYNDYVLADFLARYPVD